MSDQPPNPGFSMVPVTGPDDAAFAEARAWATFRETGDQQSLLDLGVLTEPLPDMP